MRGRIEYEGKGKIRGEGWNMRERIEYGGKGKIRGEG